MCAVVLGEARQDCFSQNNAAADVVWPHIIKRELTLEKLSHMAGVGQCVSLKVRNVAGVGQCGSLKVRKCANPCVFTVNRSARGGES